MEKSRKSLMKGIISFALALALVMGTVPIDGFVSIVQADDQIPVTYIDANGEERSTTDYTVLNDGSATALEEGWYVVPKDSTVDYTGTLTVEQVGGHPLVPDIANKTLVPAYGVRTGSLTGGTLSGSPAAFAIKDYEGANKTVTLAVTPDENYTTGTVSYNDDSDHTLTPVNGIYTFTMPEKSVTASAVFLKSLNHGDITVNPIADQTYTGSAITPEPTVKDGETILTKDTDYTLSYSNNINAAESTATNAPTVTITGKGSYSGTRTVKFTIKQKPVTVGGIKAKNKVYDTTTTAELDCSGATYMVSGTAK